MVKKKKKKRRNKKKKSWLQNNLELILECISAFFIALFLCLLIYRSITVERYQVTFDSLGGTQVTSQKVIVNQKVNKPKNPKRKGYRFAGWYLDGEEYDFNNKVTQDMKLEAKWYSLDTTKVQGVNIEEEVYVLVNNYLQLQYVVDPDTAYNKSVFFYSSDEEIATVDHNGIVRGIKAGEVEIKVVTDDGEYSDICHVTVVEKEVPASKFSLNVDSLTLTVGSSEIVTPYLEPHLTTDRLIMWNSADKTIATVDNGTIYGVKEGTTTITATTKSGLKTSIEVTVVSIPVTSLTLNMNDIDVEVGSRVTLKATIEPSNASNKEIIWSSSDVSVASINKQGVVTTYSPGSVVITATTADGKFTKACNVTVNAKNADNLINN